MRDEILITHLGTSGYVIKKKKKCVIEYILLGGIEKMGAFSDLCNIIGKYIDSKGKVTEKEWQRREENRRHAVFVKNQWKRLFSTEDISSMDVFREFSECNQWVDIDYDILEKQFSVYVDGEKYDLFQTDEEHAKMRIMPVVYSVFQIKLKKFLKKNGY